MIHTGFILMITGFLLMAFTTPQQHARQGNLLEAHREDNR